MKILSDEASMRPDEDLNEQCANMAEEDYKGELPDDKDIRVEMMGLL